MEYLVPCIAVVGILVFFLVKKIKENSIQREIDRIVAWCVTTDSSIFRSNFSLKEYIVKAQNKLNLSQEYRIKGDYRLTAFGDDVGEEAGEWVFVESIISEFNKNLIQEYFIGKLSVLYRKHNISKEEHFFYLLQRYLEKHQCDYELAEHKLIGKTIKRKDYGSWGAPHYDATYALTDFAVAFNKLFYISYMYCKTNPVINPKGEFWSNEHYIEEIIKTRQISVSSL